MPIAPTLPFRGGRTVNHGANAPGSWLVGANQNSPAASLGYLKLTRVILAVAASLGR